MSNTAPFELGKTWSGDSETIDVSSTYANVPAQHLEGRECNFGDITSTSTRPNTTRSADVRKTIIVRNVMGGTLQGGYPVVWSVPGKRVNRYARITFEKVAGIVDPSLGSTGVRDGDLFHLIVDGAVVIKNIFTTPDANTSTCAVGDPVYATTHDTPAGTTTNVTFIPRFSSGAITNSAAAGTSVADVTYVGRAARNAFGYAGTSFTIGTTNTDVLIHVRCDK